MPRARSSETSTAPSVSSHSNLVPLKYGSSTRPVRARTRSRCPCAVELGAARRGAAVLPDDRVGVRLARRAVPGDDGLALVGDADRRDVLGADGARRPRRASLSPPSRSRRRRARPSPGCGIALRELAVRRDRRPVVGEHGAAADAGRAGVDRDHTRPAGHGGHRTRRSPARSAAPVAGTVRAAAAGRAARRCRTLTRTRRRRGRPASPSARRRGRRARLAAASASCAGSRTWRARRRTAGTADR